MSEIGSSINEAGLEVRKQPEKDTALPNRFTVIRNTVAAIGMLASLGIPFPANAEKPTTPPNAGLPNIELTQPAPGKGQEAKAPPPSLLDQAEIILRHGVEQMGTAAKDLYDSTLNNGDTAGGERQLRLFHIRTFENAGAARRKQVKVHLQEEGGLPVKAADIPLGRVDCRDGALAIRTPRHSRAGIWEDGMKGRYEGIHQTMRHTHTCYLVTRPL